MIAVTLADLVFRARQFVVAIVGVSLVLSIALLLSGLANGFSYEIQQTVDGFGANNWVLSQGAHGRLTGVATFPQSVVADVARQGGVMQAQPLAVFPSQTTEVSGKTVTLNLAGVVPGALGSPTVQSGRGRALGGPSDAVVDSRLKLSTGSQFVVGGQQLTVVGTVSNRTLLGGVPLVYVPLPTAQRLVVANQPLITAVLLDGHPSSTPAGLQVLSPSRVVDDSLTQMASGVTSINNSKILMWVIAILIIGALLYVIALERRRDFAVLKALGASTRSVFGGIVIEAVLVAAIAAAVGAGLSTVMTFVFVQPVDVPSSAYATLPVVAIAVGLLASLGAVRRTVRADPASAFA